MIDYEEVVEAIWRYDCPRIDSDEDITTLYADGKAFAQVIHRADGSREDLYFEDYELQKDILIKPNATLRDVVELCMNGDISYADAREWCMENDISLGQFDRWLYGALRKSDDPARVEPKEPWPYRVVAGIRGSWSRQKISRRLSRKAWLLRRNMLRVISVGTGLAD